jgi:hypothetical protein
MNPIHIPKLYVPKIHLNVILPSTPRSSEWSPPFRLPNQNVVGTSHLPHARHMPRPSHPPCSNHPNNYKPNIRIKNNKVLEGNMANAGNMAKSLPYSYFHRLSTEISETVTICSALRVARRLLSVSRKRETTCIKLSEPK